MIELAALAVASATTTPFIDYPALSRRRTQPIEKPIEMVVDRGPILELVVRCSTGTGILSYSKIERRYCSSKSACFATFAGAHQDTCR